MLQLIEQTDEEKLKMYMKCTKKELAEMLIQCNKIIDAQKFPGYVLHSKTAQLCPVCQGKQSVPANFYGSEQIGGSTFQNVSPTPCRTCNGVGVLYT